MRDLLITNGNVWTGDPGGPRAEAVAISGNRIVGAGSEDIARGAVNRDADVIDAGGRTVLPGLIDAHNHYLATAEALASVNVRFPAVASRADLTRVIGEAAEVTPPGRWIRAVGLDWSKFPDGQPPTRQDLDEATLGHPVIVYHVSVHHALVNTPAMRERGITDGVQDPPGGRFVRDEAGRLTGLCLDAATDLILPVAIDIGCHGPNFHTILPGEDSVALLAEASKTYLAAGLTTVCDPQVTRREMRIYREAAARGLLGLRVALMPLSNHLPDFAAVGIAPPFGDDRLRIAAMKLYADGTLIGGTAWFSEPYGPHGEFTGSTYWQPEQLKDLVVRAHAQGWQVGIHTQGDRAMAMSLDAIETAMRAAPRHDTRHRIEHCGYPTPAQVQQMASLGVIPVNQPNFLIDSGDDFMRHLGHRAHRLQPIREELDAGIRPVLSSDAFVSSLRPLDTISAAMTRRTRDGAPIGEHHRMTLDEALHAHTIDAAVAIGMDDRIGSLQPGKLADVTIVDGNLEATAPRSHRGPLDVASAARRRNCLGHEFFLSRLGMTTGGTVLPVAIPYSNSSHGPQPNPNDPHPNPSPCAQGEGLATPKRVSSRHASPGRGEGGQGDQGDQEVQGRRDDPLLRPHRAATRFIRRAPRGGTPHLRARPRSGAWGSRRRPWASAGARFPVSH